MILAIRVELPEDAADRVLVGGQDETLAGLIGMDAVVDRIELVHRTDLNDPATERVITIPETSGTFRLLESWEVRQEGSRRLLFLNVPVGYVMQIRFVISEMTIEFEESREDVEVFEPVKIPSGQTSGLKFNPADQSSFVIEEGKRTAVELLLRPFKDLRRNRGQGFMMHPSLTGRTVPFSSLGIFSLDRVVVGYGVIDPRALRHRWISTMRCPFEVVENFAHQSLGAEIVGQDETSGYYVFQLPPGVLPEDAFQRVYAAQPQFIIGSEIYNCKARFELPDFPVEPQALPCELSTELSRQPFTGFGAEAGWDLTTGSEAAVVAIVDAGFDLNASAAQLGSRLFINIGELPPDRFDRNNDGRVEEDDIRTLEFAANYPEAARDGILTFTDLNTQSFQDTVCAGSGTDCLDVDQDGDVDIFDLVSGEPFNTLQGRRDASCDKPGALVGLEDGIDNDENGFCDDLVGWNFLFNSNLVHFDLNRELAHGTHMAETVAAAGGVAGCGAFDPTDTAGVMWGGGRILLVQKGITSAKLCNENLDCSDDLACVNNRCVPCKTTMQCRPNQYCDPGLERCSNAECILREDCRVGEFCNALEGHTGYCIPQPCDFDEMCLLVGGECGPQKLCVAPIGPLAIEDFASTRAAAYLGIRYAYNMGADVVNFSAAMTLYREERGARCTPPTGTPDQGRGWIENVGRDLAFDLDGDGTPDVQKWDNLVAGLQEEAFCMTSRSSGFLGLASVCAGTDARILVNASGNCKDNLDQGFGSTFTWPVNSDAGPWHVVVGSVNTSVQPFSLEANEGNWGANTVDILGPNGPFYGSYMEPNPDTPNGIWANQYGTSYAAAFVSGVFGLMISRTPIGEEDRVDYNNWIRDKLLNNAQAVGNLNTIANQGRVVDVCRAVAQNQDEIVSCGGN